MNSILESRIDHRKTNQVWFEKLRLKCIFKNAKLVPKTIEIGVAAKGSLPGEHTINEGHSQPLFWIITKCLK